MKFTTDTNGDIWLLVTSGLLLLFGFIMLASATSALAYNKFDGDSYFFVKSQGVHLVLGLIAFWVMARIDYHYWKRWAWILWLVSVLLLLSVFIPGIGEMRNSARSWISIAGFSFQPVEFVKLFFIIYLSTWLSEKSLTEIRGWYGGLIPFFFNAGVLIALLMLQPDIGSMILFAIISITIFFLGGASGKQMAAIIGLGLAAIPLLFISASYRLARFTTFLNPEADPTGTGYHLYQSLIAVGSGGIFGKGFGNSAGKFKYLPEVAGDSIFAVIAEELGFVFVVLLIIAFFILFQRGLRAASFAQDVYGKLMAVGIASWIIWQAFLNIGAIIGVLPLTGLPLPFISQGGTSLVALLAGVGILYNISKQGRTA